MRSRRTRAALAAATAALAALALAGCASGSSLADGELSYWAAFPSIDTQRAFQTIYVDAFNDSHDAVTVTMEVKQLQTLGRLTDTAVAAGRGADVVYAAGPSSALGLSSAGRITDLDAYARGYDWASKLQPWALQASQVDGKLASLPIGYGSIVMFYNPAVFEEHGWTVPATASEFEDVAQKAQDAGLVPIGAGNSGYRAQSEWYLSAVLNAAVGPDKLHDVLTGNATFTDAPFVSAISALKDQVDKGWWGGAADRWFTNTDADMMSGLATGKVAMYITGTWAFSSASAFFGEAAGNDAEWNWAPIPSMSDHVQPGVFPLAIGTSLALNARTRNPDGAAAFIDSLVNDPVKAYGYTKATGENPPPLSDISSIPAGLDERISRLYRSIPESDNLGYASWTFLPAATDTYLYTEFDKVITGDVSPRDYLAGLQSTFDGERAAGRSVTPFTPGVRQ